MQYIPFISLVLPTLYRLWVLKRVNLFIFKHLTLFLFFIVSILFLAILNIEDDILTGCRVLIQKLRYNISKRQAVHIIIHSI